MKIIPNEWKHNGQVLELGLEYFKIQLFQNWKANLMYLTIGWIQNIGEIARSICLLDFVFVYKLKVQKLKLQKFIWFIIYLMLNFEHHIYICNIKFTYCVNWY